MSKKRKRDGKPGDWYEDESIAGYYDENGRLIVVEGYGSDEEFDRYAVDLANGDGYYDASGKFVRYPD